MTRWWPALADHLAARYPLERRTEDSLLLAWPGADGEQTVQAKLLVVAGRARILFTAEICRADEVSPRDALELGSKILVGGIVLFQGVLSLRHIFSEDPVEPPPVDLVRHPRIVRLLDETIRSLRDDAVRIRRILRRRQTARKHAYSTLF